MEFLENRTGQITAEANNSTINLFNSHSKDQNYKLLSSGKAISQKFNILYSLKKYVKSVLL